MNKQHQIGSSFINELEMGKSAKRSAAKLFYGTASLPPFDQFCYQRSLQRLQNKQQSERELSDILDTVYQYRGVGRYRSIKPAQIRSELRELTERVRDINPDTVLEIGSARGGTLYTWARALPASTVYSLDLPDGDFGEGYDRQQAKFFNQFNTNIDITCLRDNSHSLSTQQRLKEHLDGDTVDYLFIDGDHTYGGVKADFEMYSPLVSDGGIIAFHDIAPHPRSSKCEVDVFWDELMEKHGGEEIISSPDQSWAGIGIIQI